MTSNNELRSAAALLTAAINNMCNAKDTEEVSKEFIQAKRTVLELLKNCSDEYKRICFMKSKSKKLDTGYYVSFQ